MHNQGRTTDLTETEGRRQDFSANAISENGLGREHQVFCDLKV